MQIRKKITIVSNCPRCNSNQTGFYIHTKPYEIKEDVLMHAKRGEIVRPLIDYDTVRNNCFCNDCGFNWREQLEYKKMTSEEIKELVIQKRTTEKEINKKFIKKKTKKKSSKKEKIKDIAKRLLKLI